MCLAASRTRGNGGQPSVRVPGTQLPQLSNKWPVVSLDLSTCFPRPPSLSSVPHAMARSSSQLTLRQSGILGTPQRYDEVSTALRELGKQMLDVTIPIRHQLARWKNFERIVRHTFPEFKDKDPDSRILMFYMRKTMASWRARKYISKELAATEQAAVSFDPTFGTGTALFHPGSLLPNIMYYDISLPFKCVGMYAIEVLLETP
ncbi:hypothetical protein B0H21DRAFT_724612 [Amylocystis lapponica]|nr:hypothetical protein B0H21DRAFT_724612 [Amylocystis lapponica]